MKESVYNVLSSLVVIEVIISIVAAYRLHMESKSKRYDFEYSCEAFIY